MLVPGALFGELVCCWVNLGIGWGRWVFVELLEVLEFSESWRDLFCKRDVVCRGCQLCLIMIDEEMNFYVCIVREVVEKFAGIALVDQPFIEIIMPQPI